MPFMLRAAATAGVFGFAMGSDNTCSLPSETGLCKAAMTRWFHNAATNQCETFTYGGCGGNANNFLTQDACQAGCPTTPVCEQPQVVGPCRAAHQKWWHNSQTGQCEQFTYGGCDGNLNNFDTPAACEQQCPVVPTCQQPMVVGPCRAAFPSWYFNSATSECEEFLYGGCNGNQNRFATADACQDQCGPTTLPAPTPVCEQPQVVGPCRAAIQSWYHDTASGKCKKFIYGGCSGNENRFASKRSCNKACNRDECALPAETGMCRAAMPMWFFNKDSRACEQFTYGGCGGNDNRFETQSKCENRCGESLLAAGKPTVSEGAKGGLSTGAVAGIGGGAGALVAATIAACMVVARKRSEEQPSVAAAEEQLKAAADV